MNGLACDHLDVRIADIQVANGLELEIKPGQFWGLLGPNGIGKTTLLKCLAGLDPPLAGRVLLESRDINELPRKLLARHIGMLQHFDWRNLANHQMLRQKSSCDMRSAPIRSLPRPTARPP